MTFFIFWKDSQSELSHFGGVHTVRKLLVQLIWGATENCLAWTDFVCENLETVTNTEKLLRFPHTTNFDQKQN